MKHLIAVLLLLSVALCGTLVDTETTSYIPDNSHEAVPPLIAPNPPFHPSKPDASITMDDCNSDAAKIPTRPAASGIAGKYALPKSILNSGYTNANNAWNYLQKIGGGCCDNCSRICGMAIKIYGTKYYLTNKVTWYQFEYTTSSPNANQIFTIGQNIDCTWYISNGGSYLSTTSMYGGLWVGPSSTVGFNERWYIERAGAYVFVQSAAMQYYYWRASISPWYFLGYSYGFGTRLTFEYYPCDKNFGWNW